MVTNYKISKSLRLNNSRLNPSRFNSRYYILKLLREQIEIVANTYLTKIENAILVDLGCGTMPYRPILGPFVSQYIGIDLSQNDKTNIETYLQRETSLSNDSVKLTLSLPVIRYGISSFCKKAKYSCGAL